MYYTVNYLFASYLQTSECGNKRIQKVEQVRPGKAKYFFDISPEEVEELQLKFHASVCLEFERIRKSTIDLAYK